MAADFLEEARRRVASGQTNNQLNSSAGQGEPDFLAQARQRVASGQTQSQIAPPKIVKPAQRKTDAAVQATLADIGSGNNSNSSLVAKATGDYYNNTARKIDRVNNRAGVVRNELTSRLAEETASGQPILDPVRDKLKGLERQQAALEAQREKEKADAWEQKQKAAIDATGNATLLPDLQRLAELENQVKAYQGMVSMDGNIPEVNQAVSEYLALQQKLKDQYGKDLNDWKAYASRVGNREMAEQVKADAFADAKNNWFGMTLARAPINAVSGIGFVDANLQKAQRLLTGSDAPIDYNTPAMQLSQMSNAITEGATERIEEDTAGKLGSDTALGNIYSGLYNLGVSMGDSVIGMATGTSLLMAGAAATNAMVEAKERGATDNQALLFGLAAGAMEGVMEKASIDSLFNMADPQTTKQLVLSVLKQGGVEASEEVLTTIANTVADALIMGNKNQLTTAVNDYIEQGYSPEEAEKMAMKDWGNGLVMDAIGGLISGGTFEAVKGGTGYISNRTGTNQAQNPVDAAIQNTLQENMPRSQQNEAYGTVENILAMPRINNTIANEIINNADAAQAFTDITGVALEGTTEQKRQIIRDAVREWQNRQVENEALAREAGEQTTAEYEKAQAEQAVRESGLRSYVIGMLTHNGTSTADAMEILRSPELKAEWEAITGKKLPENHKSALKMIQQTKRDPLRIPQQGESTSATMKQSQVDAAIQETLGQKETAPVVEPKAKPVADIDAAYNAAVNEANGAAEDTGVKTTDAKPAMGAADYGFSPYSNYQNTQSDFLPEGANAARPVDMPATDPTGRPTRRGAKTLYGAEITSDARAEQMELEFMQGVYGYDKKTNQAAVDRANATLKQDGYDRTYAKVVERLRDLKDLKQTMTEAILLYNDAIQNGNDADAAELALLMSMSGTEGGQLVQAFSMFRQLTPEGQLEGVQRVTDRINEKTYGKRKDGNSIPKYQRESVEATIDDVRETALRLLGNIHDALSDSNPERKHGVPVENWMTEIGKQLAKTIGATPSDPKPTPISKIIKQDLLRFAKDYLPKKPQGQKRTAADTLTDFFANREAYVEAWNAAKEAYRAKHGDDADFSGATITFNGIGTDPVMVQAIVDEVTSQELNKQKIDLFSYLGDQASLEKQIADGLINRTGATDKDADMIRQAVNRYFNETRLDANIERIGKGLDRDIQKALKSTGSSMYAVIRDSKGNKGAAAKIIANMMVKQYGISQDAAKTASAKIVDRFNAIIAEQSQKTLDAMFGDREKVAPKSAVQKVTEMGNLGAFDNENYQAKAAEQAGKLVDSDMKNAIRDIGVKTAEIIRSNKADKSAVANQIKDMLMKDHRLVGQDAQKMADFILDRFNAYVAEQSEAALKSRFGKKDKKQKKTFEQDFAELANMGAFTNANWKDAVAEKLFGHEITIDPDLIQKFREAPDQQARDAVMEEIYKDVGKKIPTTFGEAANQWRYTAMLFNPSTHIKNMSGNLSMMVMKMGKDAVGAGIETVANAATKGKAGRTKSILNVFSKQDQQLMQQAWADFENVEDDVKGVGKNKDNTMGKIGEHRDYWKLNNPETKVAKALDATLRAAEKVPKFNNKAMDREDRWFSRPDYALSLAGYMKANKLTEITPEARVYAIKEAQKATFRDANAVSDFAKRMGNTNSKLWNGIVNAIFPFKATPANVGVRAVEYSPVGLITTIGKAVKAKQNGTFKATDLIDDLSANFVGTTLAAVGYLLAQDGFLRATGVGDEKEKEAQREAGYKDNSFELFGYSIPETMLTSASTPMFVGAALYEALATKALDKEAYTLDDVLQALAATTDPLVGQTMLDGLSDTLYSVRNAQGGVGEWLVSSAVNVAGNYLASYIPTLVSRISAAADGVVRETYIDKNSWVPRSIQKEAQDLMMKTPLRTKLPEKVDNYGRTQENWMSDADTKVGKALGAALNVVTPTFPSKIKTTDVEAAMQELYRSGADTSDKKVFQTEAPKQITVDGEKVNLTAEEHEKLEKIRGEYTQNYQAGLQENDAFERMPADLQVSATDKMYDYIEQRSKMAMGIGYKPETWVSDLQNASPEQVSEVIVQRAVEGMAEDKRLYENKYIGISEMLDAGKTNETVALAIMSDSAVDGYMTYCKKAGVPVADYAEVHGYMNKVGDLEKTLKYIDKMDTFKSKKIALAQAVHYANPTIIRRDNPVSEDWLLKHGATDQIVEQFSESRKKLYDTYIQNKGVDMEDYLAIYNFKNTKRESADGEMKLPKQDDVIAEIDKLKISKEAKRNLFLSMDYSSKKIPYWWW